MQVNSVKDLILAKLDGSHKGNMVLLDDLLACGNNAAQEIEKLDYPERRIVQCIIERGGEKLKYVYLSCQIYEKVNNNIVITPTNRRYPDERLCTSCKNMVSRNNFGFKCCVCNDCKKKPKPPRVRKEIPSWPKMTHRFCLYCGIDHKVEAFTAKGHMCTATKKHHKQFKLDRKSARQREYYQNRKDPNYVPVGNRAGIPHTEETRKKISESKQKRKSNGK